jgi:heat shock protein HslJ
VSGFSGVNRFAGTTEIAALREGKLALTPLAVTRMAGPPAAMDLENRFLTALQQARSFRIDGDALRLAAVDGKDLLTFQRSP